MLTAKSGDPTLQVNVNRANQTTGTYCALKLGLTKEMQPVLMKWAY